MRMLAQYDVVPCAEDLVLLAKSNEQVEVSVFLDFKCKDESKCNCLTGFLWRGQPIP